MIPRSGHINRAFDEDLREARDLVREMSALVEREIRDASRALAEHDVERAGEVIALDREVDRLEEEINHAVVRIIALRQPQATDLRTVISLMKIAGNLERIGDYAKNIAKRTSVISAASRVSGASAIRRLAEMVEAMLRDAIRAYVEGDAGLAEEVRRRDEDVDQTYNSIFREFLTHMMEDPRNITPCMHYLFILKNLERMGDHVTAIAEQAIFLVTGEMPEEERPKATAVDPDAAAADD